MTIAASYAAAARLLDYPQEKEALLAAHAALDAFLQGEGLVSPASPFAAYVAGSTLASLQEEYVATFDFNPALAPYLGHHLYGDSQKKGAYLVRLKEAFGRYGYAPGGNELPDHLPLLLGFLAHLACDEGTGASRRQFIAESMLPGMEKLLAGFSRQDSPWKPVVEAALLMCPADCKEVTPC